MNDTLSTTPEPLPVSPLATALADYLAVRRAMGYKLEGAGRVLAGFVAHLDAAGTVTVTVADAATWAADTGTGGGVGLRLQCIRGFAFYLQALDPAHEVPPVGLIPVLARRAIPHLYSDADTAALMAAARQLTPPLVAATTATVIGVLAVTGMRIGEILALDLDDLAWDRGVITIRLAKFNKTRLVPVTTSTLAALSHYRSTRRQHAPDGATTKALFLSRTGNRLSYQSFADRFARLLVATGLWTRPSGTRPRIHDYRHAFAVRTLLDWYRQGADVHALLPRLSAYLGHRDPAATYWYLSAAPELMALVADRLEPANPDQTGGQR